jgi:hypothetical protein
MPNVALINGNLVSDSGVDLSTKADLVNGLVPSTQLPSYVDDVLEYANQAAFPVTGEAGKIYVALDNNRIFRWSGSTYIEITSAVGISGTTNYLSKFTSATALGNSQIFDNGTNVGIGTTTPTTRLDVLGAIKSQAALYPQLVLTENTTNTSAVIFYDGGTTPKALRFRVSDATDRMSIDATGNVGIGTTTPAQRLSVSGTGEFTQSAGNSNGTIQVQHAGVQTWKIGVTTDNTSSLVFGNDLGGSFANKVLYLANSGNVGIGTTSPSEKLHVAGQATIRSATPYLEFVDTSTNAVHYIEGTDSGLNLFADFNNTQVNSVIRFVIDGNNEKMRIFANGNVAIGSTTDSGYRLDVTGNVEVSSGKIDVIANTEFAMNLNRADVTPVAFQAFNSGSNGWIIMGAESSSGGGLFTGSSAYASVVGSASNRPLQFATNNIVRMTVDNVGNVGIGTSSPSQRLHVQGASGENQTLAGIYSGTNIARGLTIGLSADGVANDAYVVYTSTIGSGFGGHRWIVDGAERMRINAAGNVGIGTASPDFTFEVEKNGETVVATKSLADNSAAYISTYNAGGTSGNFMQMRSYGNTTASTLFGASTNKMNALWSNSDAIMAVGTIGSTPLIFGTANAERMRIFANGRVGINTGATDAGFQFDINGSTRSQGVLFVSGGSLVSQAGLQMFYNSTTGVSTIDSHHPGVGYKNLVINGETIFLQTRQVDRVTITSGGNVGIGTTSPTGRMQIQGIQQDAAQTITRMAANNASGQIKAMDFQVNAGSNLFVFNTAYAGTAMGIDFADAGTSRMRIFNSGRIGINTTTDGGYQLDVNGTARINSDLRVNTTTGFNTLFTNPMGGGGVGFVSLTDPTAADNRVFSIGLGSVNYPAQARIEGYATEAWTSTNRGSYLIFRTTPTASAGVQDRMIIGNDGFVGINTLSPAARLHVAGNMRSDNDAFFATTSGNVGIGTTTTPARLTVSQVVATSSNFITLIPTTNTTSDRYGINFSNSAWGSKAAIYGINENSGNGAGAFAIYTQNSGLSYAERVRVNSDGSLLINTQSPITPAYKLHVNGPTYGNSSIAFDANGNLGAFFINTLTVPASSTFNSGFTWGGIRSLNDLTFGGSSTIGNGAVVAGNINANRVTFSAANATITMTQGSNDARRALAAMQVLQQTGGTVNGTVDHGASLLIQGVYATSTANVTFTNYYGLLINPINEFSGSTFTNRWGVYQVGSTDKNYFNGRTLIGTTTDVGDYKLQVNGGIYTNYQMKVAAAQLSIEGHSNAPAFYIASHSVTGSSNQPVIQADVTLNTTGNVDLFSYNITNTASGASSNWIKMSDGTNTFRVTKNAAIVTSAPSGGSAKPWKLGSVVATSVVLNTGSFVEVEIDGTFYSLALVNPA